jgi:MFS family permease
MPRSGRSRTWLGRLAEYERPWVGRVGFTLVLVLWLFLSVVAFASSLAIGLAFSVVTGAAILGEVWVRRSGERHATFAALWRLSWPIAAGVALIVIAFVNFHGWIAALILTVLGALLILPRFTLAVLWWRETRQNSTDADT